MKEIALYDAKNALSALIASVEATGETIVITRHGKPAAQLGPISRAPTRARRAEAIEGLLGLRAQVARDHPDSAAIGWEELKILMRDEEA